MGNWVLSWFINPFKQECKMDSVRLDDVTEDYVDGYILALEQTGKAFGKVIKERLS